uniref:Uncharacterized protein n=1 Tax=Plectus sambesii TaxID=2011161 RepID=A0A914WZG5_9BILA
MLIRSVSLLFAVFFVFARSSPADIEVRETFIAAPVNNANQSPAWEELVSQQNQGVDFRGQLNADEISEPWNDDSTVKAPTVEEVMAKSLQVMDKEEAFLDLEYEKMELEIKILHKQIESPDVNVSGSQESTANIIRPQQPENDQHGQQANSNLNEPYVPSHDNAAMENNGNIITGEPVDRNVTKNNTTIAKAGDSDFLMGGGSRVDCTFGSILLCSILALSYFGRQ